MWRFEYAKNGLQHHAAVRLFPRITLTFLVGIGLSICCYGQQGTDLSLDATTIDAGVTLYQAPNSISNAATFTVDAAANVTFTAGNYVDLKPGFHAIAGSASITFHATIDASVQSAPITITTSQASPPSSPSKEYLYFNGRVVAIENH